MRFCTTRLFLVSALLPLCGFALTVEDFTRDATLWTDAGAPRMAELLKGGAYRWTSGAQDTLRAPKGGTLLELPAGETLVRLTGRAGRPAAVEVSLFNRGDDGDLDEKTFEKRVGEIRKAIDAAARVKPTEVRRSRLSAVRADAAIWAAAESTWYLEWSKNRETRRPEFIRLELRPAADARRIQRDAQETGDNAAKRYTPAEHLETAPDGTRWLKDVPMVDQGSKGYCAVASTERVLRLYGLPVDEHELAQLAESEADQGTSTAQLIDTFRKNAVRLRVRTQVIQDFDLPALEAFTNDYNNAARKARRPALPSPRRDPRGFSAGFEAARTSPLRVAARKGNATGVKQFERAVAAAIEKGQPVLWGVTLGLVPESPAIPQTRGGHLRLIIGYHATKHTVIYTDSWGRGHERKEMPADLAFAITDMLVTLAP